jgi:ankyrin repeat protein
MFAAENGHLDVMRLLLDRGAQLEALSRKVRTASPQHCCQLILRVYLSLLQAEYTALVYAAAGGHLAAVKLLVERGASVFAYSDVRNPCLSSPQLILRGSILTVSSWLLHLLVLALCGVSQVHCRSPLSEAVDCPSLEVAQYLLDRGANPHVLGEVRRSFLIAHQRLSIYICA